MSATDAEGTIVCKGRLHTKVTLRASIPCKHRMTKSWDVTMMINCRTPRHRWVNVPVLIHQCQTPLDRRKTEKCDDFDKSSGLLRSFFFSSNQIYGCLPPLWIKIYLGNVSLAESKWERVCWCGAQLTPPVSSSTLTVWKPLHYSFCNICKNYEFRTKNKLTIKLALWLPQRLAYTCKDQLAVLGLICRTQHVHQAAWLKVLTEHFHV